MIDKYLIVSYCGKIQVYLKLTIYKFVLLSHYICLNTQKIKTTHGISVVVKICFGLQNNQVSLSCILAFFSIYTVLSGNIL